MASVSNLDPRPGRQSDPRRRANDEYGPLLADVARAAAENTAPAVPKRRTPQSDISMVAHWVASLDHYSIRAIMREVTEQPGYDKEKWPTVMELVEVFTDWAHHKTTPAEAVVTIDEPPDAPRLAFPEGGL